MGADRGRGWRPGLGRPKPGRQRVSTSAAAPYRGSLRQVRGAVLAVLRERASASIGGLVIATGHGRERIVEAARFIVSRRTTDGT